MKEIYNPKIKNFVIRYESWEAYNTETKEQAIEMFKNGHNEDEIIEVEE
jgi:hypothetical protein